MIPHKGGPIVPGMSEPNARSAIDAELRRLERGVAMVHDVDVTLRGGRGRIGALSQQREHALQLIGSEEQLAQAIADSLQA